MTNDSSGDVAVVAAAVTAEAEAVARGDSSTLDDVASAFEAPFEAAEATEDVDLPVEDTLTGDEARGENWRSAENCESTRGWTFFD